MSLAASQPLTLSMASISPDGETLYFSCWGDIWSAPRDGSFTARRLTDNVALEDRPIVSPDGKLIAFQSDRFGNMDIFVMSADGGLATRLTFSDIPDQHFAWKPDSSAVLEYAQRNDLWSYCGWEIPITGGEPVRVTPSDFDGHLHVGYLGDTEHFVYSRGPGDWAMKRYRGSGTYDIWTYDATTGKHTQLTDYDGKDLWPLPNPDSSKIYFVSDRDGTENIWVHEMVSGKQRQLTHFRGDGPRWPQMRADGSEIICSVFGELYIVPTDGGSPEKVEITFADDPKHDMKVSTDFRGNVGEYALSPNGNYFAITVYGDVYLLKNPEKYEDEEPDQDVSRARPLVTGLGREMDLAWHPSSKKLAYVSDRDGQYDLYMLDLVKLEETRLTDTPVEEALPKFAPRGERLAYYSGNRELRLLDLDSGEDQLLHDGTVKWGPWVQGFEWAPGGYWLLFGEDFLDYQQELFLINIEDREPINITEQADWTGNAFFSPDGKYLAFTSSDDFGASVELLELDPEEETYDFDLLFKEDVLEDGEEDVGNDEDARASGDESEDEDEGTDEDADGDDGEDEDADPYAELDPISIDFNRIHLRAETLTPFAGNAVCLGFNPESKYLIFTSDHTGEEELWSVNLEGDELSNLGSATNRVQPQFSPDGKRLYYLENGCIAYLEMSGGQSSGGGGLPTTCFLEFDQHAIWEQELREGWRILDQGFYDEDMGGVDWDEVLSRYLPLVRACGSIYEFGRIYREMLGELGRSHLGYYGYGNEAELPRDTTADLGVIWDEGYPGPGWRVARVLHDGPASKAGSELYAGDIVLAIDGEELVAGENHAARLNNLVDQPLMLTVKSSEEALATLAKAAEKAAAEESEKTKENDEVKDNSAEEAAEVDIDLTEREVPIKPVSQASMATPRYEQWVENNRETVYRLSNGRIAYQHIRSMNQPEADKFHRELFSESFDKDALIIDVRFNGGGWTAVMIMDILNEVPAYLRARRDQPFQNYGRQYVWQGPIVVLCNRHSFSNAEIFSHIMKDTRMATLIGEPTPGGVISTSSYELMDGSSVAIPGGGNWRLTGEDMETGGAIPDIVVYIDPHTLAEGHDNQLETAVEYLLGEIE